MLIKLKVFGELTLFLDIMIEESIAIMCETKKRPNA